MTEESREVAEARKRVLRWYGAMVAGDFFYDIERLVEAVRKDEREQAEGLVFALLDSAEIAWGSSRPDVSREALEALYVLLSPEAMARLTGGAAPVEGGTEG